MKRATAFARLQHTHTQLRLNATVIMRILPTLFFLPVLIAVGACTQTVPSAIANDDRPSLLPNPRSPHFCCACDQLTIESLAGTYQFAAEQQLKAELDRLKLSNASRGRLLNEEELKQFEMTLRPVYDRYKKYQIKIYANSTFEILPGKLNGQVKLDGKKLILATDSTKTTIGTNDTTKLPEPSTIILIGSMSPFSGEK